MSLSYRIGENEMTYYERPNIFIFNCFYLPFFKQIYQNNEAWLQSGYCTCLPRKWSGFNHQKRQDLFFLPVLLWGRPCLVKMGTTHLSEFSHNWLGRYPKDTHLFTMRKGSGHPISLYYGLEHVKAPTLHIPKTASAKGLPWPLTSK